MMKVEGEKMMAVVVVVVVEVVRVQRRFDRWCHWPEFEDPLVTRLLLLRSEIENGFKRVLLPKKFRQVVKI